MFKFGGENDNIQNLVFKIILKGENDKEYYGNIFIILLQTLFLIFIQTKF